MNAAFTIVVFIECVFLGGALALFIAEMFHNL
jgi:hypothetical protein